MGRPSWSTATLHPNVHPVGCLEVVATILRKKKFFLLDDDKALALKIETRRFQPIKVIEWLTDFRRFGGLVPPSFELRKGLRTVQMLKMLTPQKQGSLLGGWAPRTWFSG